MRTWLKLAAVAGGACWASTAIAADHRDGSVVDDPAADINDVYAFMDSTGDNVVLAMTTEPFAATGTQFSDAVQYVFHVQAHPAFGEASAKNTDIICTFEGTEATCWVGADGPTVRGDIAAGDISSEEGDVRVFAGLRGDPFFFYLQGFVAARAYVLANAASLAFTTSGCPIINLDISNDIVGRLTGAIDPSTGTAVDPPAPVNDFVDANTLALVIELDKELLIDGAATTLSVWASTHTAP